MGERLILVVMIDALGHRIVRETGVFDFLEAPDGPVSSVCGYSSACIPSLLTDRLPVQHGHWAMFLRDPEGSVFRRYRPLIGLVSGLLGRDGSARRWISRGLKRGGVTGYFSLYEVPLRLLPQFDLCQKRDIYAPGAFPSLRTPFDASRELGLSCRVWSWRTPEEQNRTELARAIQTGRHEMLFFYSPLLDAVMHAHGTRSRETLTCLRDFESFVQKILLAALGAYDEVRLLVFGDHGMADVTTIHDLLGRIESLRLRVARDMLYFVDATMARFWFFKPGLRGQVEELLQATECGRVIDDEECEKLGILFPDRRYGELIFLADPGTMFVPSFMGRTGLKAMHGYHPQDVDSDTLLLCNFRHRQVGTIMDIGRLLVSELEALAAIAPGGRT